MTSQVKSLVVISRIREAINNLVFETGSEKIRASLSAGFSSIVHENAVSFDELMNQADDALLRALSKSAGEKVVGYVEEEVVEEEPEINKAMIDEAIRSVIDGNYYQLNDTMLQLLKGKLTPFFEYIANHTSDVKKSGS